MKSQFWSKISHRFRILFGLILLVTAFIIIISGYSISNKQEKKQIETSALAQMSRLTEFLRILNRQSTNELLTAERISLNFFQQTNFILENQSLTEQIETPVLNSDQTNILNIPVWTLNGEKILQNKNIVDNLTRISGAEISIWQKIPEGYVRITGNEKDASLPVLLYNSASSIQRIEKGEKLTEYTQSDNEQFLSEYCPLYISGKIKGMIKIKINTQIPVKLNALIRCDLTSKFIPFYIDNNGKSLIESGLIFNSSNSQLFIEMSVSNRRKSEISGNILRGENLEHGTIWFSKVMPSDVIIGIFLPDSNRSFFKNSLLVFGTLIFFAVSYGFFLFFTHISEKSSTKINTALSTIAEGRLQKKISVNYSNLSKPTQDVNLIIERNRTISDALDKLIQGDYTIQNANDKDVIMISLNELQSKLSSIENAVKIQNEEVALRQKISEWNAKITEILQYSTSVKELSHGVIRALTDFLEIEQAASYFINDIDASDIFLELTAGFAYSKNRIFTEKISIQDGLTARCIKEKQEILLSEIPSDYIKIVSGFGETLPKYLVLVPLIFNNEVYGVIEMASLKEIQAYKIEFVKTIGENISSTFSGIRNNEKNATLLEQTRRQTEQVALHDKEIEEELNRLYQFRNQAEKTTALAQSIFSVFNYACGTAELDLKSSFLSVNSKFAQTIELKSSEIIGKSYTEIFNTSLSQDTIFTLFDEIIAGNNRTIFDKIISPENKEIWLEMFLSPIKNPSGKVTHIIIAAYDKSDIYATNNLMQNLKLEMKSREYSLNIIEKHNERNRKYLDTEKALINSLLHGIDSAFIRIEYSTDAAILSVNKKYEELTGFSATEVCGTKLDDKLPENEKKQFLSGWKKILAGEELEGMIQIKTKDNRNLFLVKSHIPLTNVKGNVEKILFIAIDVSPFFQR